MKKQNNGMKAREIQIGDWVDIPQAGVGIRKIDVGDISFFTEFDPIPLTAEILEKNGFVKVNSQRYRWGELCGAILFHVDANPVKGYFYITNESHANHANVYNGFYVHTLQHALRLCGLADLADNFTI